MRKPIISLFLACVLMLTGLPALAQEAAGSGKVFVMAGYDGDDMHHDWSTNLFFQRMKEKTGISFDFRQFTDYASWTAEKARLFAGDEPSGGLPDVLFKAELTPTETLTYYQSGKLIDLAPLLKENAPNLSALLEANPDWKKAVTLPDGAIAALPFLNPIRAQNAMWINSTWLSNLKLDMPTDYSSLRAVLEAFRDEDPNQNGKKDEVPLAFLGPWDLKFLAHAFGLIANDYNVYADASGKVQFMPSQAEYKDFVAWLASMYSAKLLDQNGFTTADSLRTITDSSATVTYGILMGPNPNTIQPAALGVQYTLLPPLAYNGTQIYRDLTGPVTRGAFAITSQCQDPAALLQWVDTLYGEEGGKLAFVGQEGVEYTFNQDGTWSLTASSEDASTVAQSATIADSGTIPGLNPVSFLLKHEEPAVVTLINGIQSLGDITKLPFPTYCLTQEQASTVAPMQNTLGKYVDESLARFVLGEVQLTDENWQAYLDKLNELGLADFLSFWQQVLDGQAR